MHLETQIFPVHSSNPTFVKFSIMDKIRQRLSDLGYAIYDAPAPVGSYVQCVRTGNLLHLSGGISVNGEDKYFGKVGQIFAKSSLKSMRRISTQKHSWVA